MRFEKTCCHRTSRKKISTDLDSMRYDDNNNNNDDNNNNNNNNNNKHNNNNNNNINREEYKQVMEAYVTAQMKPSGETNTKQTYLLWRKSNTTRRLNIDANKLANVRRNIIKKRD